MAGFIMELIYQHFILFSLLFLAVGFLIGRIYKNISQENKIESFFTKESKNKAKEVSDISIDETTHVVPINTGGLEKKYSNMGEHKTTSENISMGIEKLKGLKK